jgi:hypothetical protein
MNFDKQRFRSFCERYLIERAGSFLPGQERQDAWNAVLDANAIYKIIEQQGEVAAEKWERENSEQWIAQQAAQNYDGIGP